MKLLLSILIALAVATSAHRVKVGESDPCFFHGQTSSCLSNRFEFTQGERAAGSETKSLVFAIKQRNTAMLDAIFDEVSNPDHEKYGSHHSLAQIGEMTGDAEATQTVMSWLQSNGVTDEQMKPTINGEFIKVSVPVSLAEELLQAEFHHFESPHKMYKGKQMLRTRHYSLPVEIAEVVDFVGHTVVFPSHTEIMTAHPATADAVEGPKGFTVPGTIVKAYGMTETKVATELSTQSLFESLGQSYSPDDLRNFFEKLHIPPEKIKNVIGVNHGNSCVSNPAGCGEANLDVQYIMALAEDSPTTFWSISGNQEPFLDWIVAVANTQNPPLVHSVSYGGIEVPMNAKVMSRFNQEIQKMGVRGLTVVIASGDDGVANFIARQDPTKCGFTPSYPATSPYVTAVGATQGPENDEPEVAESSDTGGTITSGGGFSNVFRMPNYQAQAVQTFKQNNKLPPSSMFSQEGRGYPDVAMMGHNYVVSIGGNLAAVSGTSAAAPVFASFITLINSFRLKENKQPLGFLNPVLYKLAQTNPEVFNDITSGSNNCCAGAPGKQVCCQYGFEAVQGWDPITGLGSVNYAALKKALIDL